MKKIAVIGLGQFGRHLATTLADLGCQVLAVDFDERAVRGVQDEVQQAVITDVRSFEALDSVISDEFDEAVVSLGESLEASILCTLHIHQIGVKRIRAKAFNQDHADILKAVGATDVIFPEKDSAERMARYILQPNLLDFLPLPEEYRVSEVKMPPEFVGRTLVDLQLRTKYHVVVIAIKREDGEKVRFMPAPDATLGRDDVLVVIGKGADISKLNEEK